MRIQSAQNSGSRDTVAAGSTVNCADGYEAAILGEVDEFAYRSRLNWNLSVKQHGIRLEATG